MPRGLQLERHPESQGGEGLAVTADVLAIAPGRLSLRYVVAGAVDRLVIPPTAVPTRRDELWRRTCFELFLPRQGAAYYEFNLAPSTEWAAYSFDGYRAGMALVELAAPPRIEGAAEAGSYVLAAELDVSGLTGLPTAAAWRLGVTAVLEEVDGSRSYWALRHAPGKPDFHHPDSFALDLPPTDVP